MQSEKQTAKTRQEMAAKYGINVKTFYRWLKKASIQLSGGRVTPAEQELIYQKFGKPKRMQMEKV
ncbi:MAG: hypothetical protein ACK4TA_18230 [Saprospiraceae bacterium]